MTDALLLTHPRLVAVVGFVEALGEDRLIAVAQDLMVALSDSSDYAPRGPHVTR